jgi:S1-C subfamily serine protease
MEGRSQSLLMRAAGLVIAAVGGGAIALGGAAALGKLGHNTTTVREVAPAATQSESVAFAKPQNHPLTIHQIYERSAPGVVQVTSTSVVQSQFDPFTDPFAPLGPQTQQSLGSGFVVDKTGHIVTNYHVVQGAQTIDVSFSNHESMKAHVVGSDPSTDIAVLKVDASSRALTPLPLGDSDKVRVGDSVVAIGNPFGLDRTVTAGIVSALQRQIQAPNNWSIDHVIQTDAPINHGNSGGPLLNANGQVIGVNAQIQTGGTTDGNVGIGFAIPINTVKNVAASLIKRGRVEHAYIGIDARGIDATLARIFRLPVSHGLLVEAVRSGSPAAHAGLRGGDTQVTVAGVTYNLGGDVITKADGTEVSSLARLRTLLAVKKPGDKMHLTLFRGTKSLDLTVTLGRQPTSPSG